MSAPQNLSNVTYHRACFKHGEHWSEEWALGKWRVRILKRKRSWQKYWNCEIIPKFERKNQEVAAEISKKHTEFILHFLRMLKFWQPPNLADLSVLEKQQQKLRNIFQKLRKIKNHRDYFCQASKWELFSFSRQLYSNAICTWSLSKVMLGCWSSSRRRKSSGSSVISFASSSPCTCQNRPRYASHSDANINMLISSMVFKAEQALRTCKKTIICSRA